MINEIVELELVEFCGLVARLEVWLVELVSWLTEGVVRFEDVFGKPDEIGDERDEDILIDGIPDEMDGADVILTLGLRIPDEGEDMSIPDDMDGVDVVLTLVLGNPDGEDVIAPDVADETLALALGTPDEGEDVIVAVLFDGMVGSPDEGIPPDEAGIIVLLMEIDALEEGLIVGLPVDVAFVGALGGPLIRIALKVMLSA